MKKSTEQAICKWKRAQLFYRRSITVQFEGAKANDESQATFERNLAEEEMTRAIVEDNTIE